MFNASDNRFEGVVNVANLPSSLRELDLSQNQLSGEPLMSSAEATLVKLDLSHNKFYGDVRLTAYSEETEVNVSNNFFSGFLIPARKMHERTQMLPQKPNEDLLLAFERKVIV